MPAFISAILIALAIVGCSTFWNSNDAPKAPQHKVSIMTFNVENLFDIQDDEGKDDKAFLPLSLKKSTTHKKECEEIEVAKWKEQCLNWDWNEDILKTKMQRVAEVILSANGGKGPDILALQEVENLRVLKQLNDEYLKEAGYKEVVLIEGADLRGIDVAFLSRFPLAGTPILHKIPFSNLNEKQANDTRGILEATFVLPDKTQITGYAVHFPAPYHPTHLRIDAYAFLNKLKTQLPGDRLAFAAGDFNTTSEEVKNKKVLDKFVRPTWLVAHQLHCDQCKGTSYYPPKDDWSFLDMLLISPELKPESKGWRVVKNSIQIMNKVESQNTKEGTPARFEISDTSGVSDHWPLYLEIVK